jgi:hypothetical protein
MKDHPRITQTSFGIAPEAFSRRLVELRRKVAGRLRSYPLSDPHRVSLGGVGLDRHSIDTVAALHFPAVLFENLAVMHGKHTFGASQKIIDQSGPVVIAGLTMQLSATLYRILKSMEDTELVQEANFAEPVVKVGNTYLNTDEHWLTKARPRSGHTSPVMIFKGRTMMIADVLMNLAYPNARLYTFGLRRRCEVKACVNPAHYIYGWNPKATEYPGIEEAGLAYHLAIVPMDRARQKPLPKYMLDGDTFRPIFSHSWKEYLNAADDYWQDFAARMGEKEERGLPTTKEGVAALFAQESPVKEEKPTGPQLGDLFKAMGGKWGKD